MSSASTPARHDESEAVALESGAGLVDFSHRTRLEISGDDRASFLHNLCTNDIKGLAVGRGCEAYLCDAKGHVLGHVCVLCRPASLLLETVPGQQERLLAHLDKYCIREKISLAGRTADTAALLVAGARAGEVLARLGGANLPAEPLASCESTLAGAPCWAACWPMTRAGGYLLGTAAEHGAGLAAALRAAGATPCSWSAFEAARIENGFPWYGIDIGDKNLPQEVGRDEQAISFKKGCYLGQETVARLDALGHVNKRLALVELPTGSVPGPTGSVPGPGDALTAAGQEVGQVTSAAWSKSRGRTMALGYLKRGHETPGAAIDWAGIRGSVVR